MTKALIPRRDLNEIEQRVIDAALRTMDETPKLQYGGRQIDPEEVQRILRRPAVQYAMRAAIKRRVATELVPASFEYLGKVVRDTTVPTRERISAAKALIDQADLKRVDEGSDDDKPLAEMDEGELRAFLSAAQAEQATRRGERVEASKGEPAPPANPVLSLETSRRQKGVKVKKAAALGPRKRDLFA